MSRAEETDYVQAMVVVDHILRLMTEEPEVILDLLDMPANLIYVSKEFDTIYQRWVEEES